MTLLCRQTDLGRTKFLFAVDGGRKCKRDSRGRIAFEKKREISRDRSSGVEPTQLRRFLSDGATWHKDRAGRCRAAGSKRAQEPVRRRLRQLSADPGDYWCRTSRNWAGR